LLRLRGEHLERPFAHLYDTGRMRRVYLRGHENILKRVLLQAGACNLGRLMRHLVGVGTPRRLQGRGLALLAHLCAPMPGVERLWDLIWTLCQPLTTLDHLRRPHLDRRTHFTGAVACTTGS